MAKPDNSIAKIKLPGENTQRPIVPYGLTDGTYYVTLPAITADSRIIVEYPNNSQTIRNHQLILSKYLTIFSDGIDDLDNPYDWADPDIDIYSTKISLRTGEEDEDEQSIEYNYYFPPQSGTIGLQIDIDDLTSIS